MQRFKYDSVEEYLFNLDNKHRFVSVKEAISDLPRLENGILGEMIMEQDELLNSLYQFLIKNIVSFKEIVKLGDKI